MQPRLMSYTPEELPQVTGTSWVSAILLLGLAWEGPFLLPAVYLQQHMRLEGLPLRLCQTMQHRGVTLGMQVMCQK